MKWFIATVLGAVIALIGAGPALAAEAQRTVWFTVPANSAASSVTIHASVIDVDCAFTVTLALTGETKSSDGPTNAFDATFTVPAHEAATETSAQVTCVYDDPSGYTEPAIVVDVDLPEGGTTVGPDTDDGLLPSTGGPTLWVLVAGIACWLVGSRLLSQRRLD